MALSLTEFPRTAQVHRQVNFAAQLSHGLPISELLPRELAARLPTASERNCIHEAQRAVEWQ